MNLLESIAHINLHENNFLEKLFKIDDLIFALIDSFMQVIPSNEPSFTYELTFIGHWLAVLIAVIKSGSLKFEDYETDERFLNLMEIMYRILKLYIQSYDLYPIRQLNADMIYNVVCLLLSFQRCDVNIPPKINHIIAILIFSLKTGNSIF